ncbi:hypothetical protein DFH94DRAFT_849887 [Russula ochroleuca]|uniref:Uncharacterized protein n=1 Tax=Russula ochroleuca TaxID=152965 RepID=A0A9P5N3E9_9AGAM|nr:hypothetical protein DFH94DRAFT_849887 [Russula ochroleuca]
MNSRRSSNHCLSSSPTLHFVASQRSRSPFPPSLSLLSPASPPGLSTPDLPVPAIEFQIAGSSSSQALAHTHPIHTTTVIGDSLHNEAINASVHDGAPESRIAPPMRRPFAHNDVRALHALRDGWRASPSPSIRGMVALLRLEVEDCLFSRLYTFDKASAASDGACPSSVSLQSSRFTITAEAY